jgi:hypothetical protein
VFENRLLQRIFGATRVEGAGGWRRLEFHNLHVSPNIIRLIKSRRMGWSEHVARMEEMRRNTHRILVVKPEGMRPLGRPKRRSEDNITLDLGK